MKKITPAIFIILFSIGLKAQSGFTEKICLAAVELTQTYVRYDPSYYSMTYPNGDVPADRGVCSDVVIRAYRKLGFDLQKAVHEDMKAHRDRYPDKWRQNGLDRNIDHRRVPNLMTYFSRHGEIKRTDSDPAHYLPGDIVAWNLRGAITHIGIVINRKSADGKRYLIVHNIGGGQEVADCLFDFRIIGHYRFEVDLEGH